MHQKPMLIIAKHSITITPVVFDLLLSYIKFFISDRQMRLQEQPSESDALAEKVVTTLQQELSQAQALADVIEPLKDEFARIYELNFVKLAEVLRKARIELGQERIEGMHSLKVVLTYLMEMLKAENPLFNREKFITYINEGR